MNRHAFHHWFTLVLLALNASATGCARKARVVVYCAQDQVYAEPVFAAFTSSTGIEVLAVYDSEAVKSVGIANRILSERAHPVADIFWGNEELQTRRLASAGAFRPTNGWAVCGQRSRRLVAGRDHLTLAQCDLHSLTNVELRGRVSMAAPWFGSTATHFALLRAEWGAEAWRGWCRALVQNQVFLEEGNSQVTRRVARGEAWVGLTDSDDVQAAQREGLGLVAGPPLAALHTTVAVLRDAPRPVAAEKLFGYLQTAEVQAMLLRAGAVETVTNRLPEPRWDVMLSEFETTGRELREAMVK